MAPAAGNPAFLSSLVLKPSAGQWPSSCAGPDPSAEPPRSSECSTLHPASRAGGRKELGLNTHCTARKVMTHTHWFTKCAVEGVHDDVGHSFVPISGYTAKNSVERGWGGGGGGGELRNFSFLIFILYSDFAISHVFVSGLLLFLNYFALRLSSSS